MTRRNNGSRKAASTGTPSAPAPEAVQEPAAPSIPELGGEVIGAYWDASADVRVRFPEKGAERNVAFVLAKAACIESLKAIGLEYTPKLPGGKAPAIKEAISRFEAQLALRAAAAVEQVAA